MSHNLGINKGPYLLVTGQCLWISKGNDRCVANNTPSTFLYTDLSPVTPAHRREGTSVDDSETQRTTDNLEATHPEKENKTQTFKS